MWALELHDTQILDLMLEKGANVNHQDAAGNSCLFWMCQYNWNDIVKYLTIKGADQNIASNNGFYPIHIAAQKADAEIINLLAEKSDVNLLSDNNFKISPFWLACNSGNIAAAKALISQNADQTLPSANGIIPLHSLLMNKVIQPEIKLNFFKELEAELDLTVKNGNGKNIFDIAKESYPEFVNYLKNYQEQLPSDFADYIQPEPELNVHNEEQSTPLSGETPEADFVLV
jgi:ankyrin repeat protein